MSPRGESGQATVEFALLLPVFVALAALVPQVGVLTRDHLVLWRTAGTAARLASIEPDDTARIQVFVDDTLHLVPTTVSVERTGDLVTTTLRHRYRLSLFFIKTPIRILDMTAHVTMHVEDTG